MILLSDYVQVAREKCVLTEDCEWLHALVEEFDREMLVTAF